MSWRHIILWYLTKHTNVTTKKQKIDYVMLHVVQARDMSAPTTTAMIAIGSLTKLEN